VTETGITGKRLFVTGGAGFIGTALIHRLIDDNSVVVYDTLARNALAATRLLNHPNLTLVQADVLDEAHLRSAMAGSQIVIHLAAVAGVDTVMRSATRTMAVNMVGTLNVLKAAVELERIDRFMDFSTSEVYGTYAFKLGENETTNMGAVGNARWTYAISKLAAEHLAHSYHKEFGLPVVSIRPFNIYGPGQIGEGAIHVFVTRALRDEDLKIHGDGDQIRSWCYIDDIVDALLLALEHPAAVGEVFNVGNPRGTITILSLAQMIVRLCNSSSRIVFEPKTYMDIELRIPRIEKAKTILGFRPQVELEEGLLRTIAWYRRQHVNDV
jgi:nucleoside-diphosphate-sugar epimerase